MDYMTDEQFRLLHGEELFNEVVVPMGVVVKEKGYNAYATCLVHGKIISDILEALQYLQLPCYSGFLHRESLIIFKENYIARYSEEEWDRIYAVMKVAFKWWLDYHKNNQ